MCVCVCVRACMHACMCECVRACVLMILTAPDFNCTHMQPQGLSSHSLALPRVSPAPHVNQARLKTLRTRLPHIGTSSICKQKKWGTIRCTQLRVHVHILMQQSSYQHWAVVKTQTIHYKPCWNRHQSLHASDCGTQKHQTSGSEVETHIMHYLIKPCQNHCHSIWYCHKYTTLKKSDKDTDSEL